MSGPYRYADAQRIYIFVWDHANHEPVTGDASNLTVLLAKNDSSTYNAVTNTITEAERGWYFVALTTTEMTAHSIHVIAETSTADCEARCSPDVLKPMEMSTDGYPGLDWANLKNKTSTQSLSNTSIKDVTDLIEVNVTQISGDSTAADELELTFQGQQSLTVNTASFTPVNAGDFTVFESLSNYFADGALVGQTIQWYDGGDVGLTATIAQFLGTDTLGGTRNRYFVTKLPTLPSSGEGFRITGVNQAIGANPFLLISTNIETLSTQTSFTIGAGSDDDDAYNGCLAILRDGSSGNQIAVGTVSDYTGSTKTVTLREDPGIFTLAVDDFIQILAVNRVTSDNSLVSATSGIVDTNVNQISGDSTAADNAELFFDDTGFNASNSTIGTASTIGDAPTNWSSMVITAGGAVDALLQGFLNTLITETTAGNVADNFDTFYDNADGLTSKTVDDVGGAGGMADWTTAERNQIRYRLQLDGTTASPAANTPGNLRVSSDAFLGTTVVETSAGNIAANFDNFYDNADALTTKVVDDVGGLSASEINTEVDNALVDIGLDHLVFTSATGTDIADNSIIAQMVSKSATADWDSFVNTTDSLEGLRDNQGGGGGGGISWQDPDTAAINRIKGTMGRRLSSY